MEVKGKFTIDCERCGKSYDFLPEDVKFKPTEKKGDDQCYTWQLQYNCLRCGNPISIKYEVCVSQDGKITDKKVDVTGAKVAEDSFEFKL